MKLVVLSVLAALVVIAVDAQSCAGRCDTIGTDSSAPCQCNKPCINYGDCCSDYEQVCLSCVDRCDIGYNSQFPCQCNTQCPNHGNCCFDFDALCEGGSGGGSVTDTELRDLSSQLFILDEANSAASAVLNLQGSTSQGSYTDKAPEPLFTSVPEDLLNSGTYAMFRSTWDNYVYDVTIAEDVTEEERIEETTLIDAILASDVGQTAANFLISKGYFADLASYRSYFDTIWFGLYTRGGGPLGSSGFEHVLVGEIKDGISGFHNWARFWEEERIGEMNYLGYIKTADLNGNTLIEMPMQWQGYNKAISSILVGTSPELELSLYTVCFVTRPNSKCPVAANGQFFSVQTYDLKQNGGTYVGTAYPTF
ncbi:uridylate-specific endoribonuclease-like isoform X1 [Artemia franciscana]|uniref:uridylate-specific endoribonuclease-like isoform X1 n=1 Tax=Artemia franciscana TaxID=6661 RepID=UPI0032D9F799